MSNIYIQEPPTKGKVILKTTLDEIAVELWSKECPKTCRNFIQLCMEGYYDGTIFHRVIKDFIAQGGDPTGTGQGGESIYGAPFKDEFHQRLRFNRRGLLGMANSQKDDNGSQFFFTLGNTPELNKKHTLFGKISDNTIFNMIKINEFEVIDERPTRPVRIISTEVIYNPFDDIKPRNLRALREKAEEKEKKVVKGVKNYGLLSFGDEAEDEEEELESLSAKFKSKSAHDIGDPTLIAKKVIENEKSERSSSSSSDDDDEDVSSKKRRKTNINTSHDIVAETKKLDLENIKSKLKKNHDENKKSIREEAPKLDEKELKIKQTQDEIKKLQKELASNQKQKIVEEKEKIEKEKEKKEETEIVLKYKEDKEKYEHLKKKKVKNAKEEKTLELLNAFRNRLFKAKTSNEEDSQNNLEDIGNKEESSEALSESDPLKAIFTHRLELDEEIKQKVIDANIADNERYDIYDPRNPLNKRKLEESRNAFREKKGHGISSSSHSSSSRSSYTRGTKRD